MPDIIDATQPLDSGLAGNGASDIRATRTALNTLNSTVEGHTTDLAKCFKPNPYYVNDASYTITDSDGYDTILVYANGADRTITLPLKANNLKRRIKILYAKGGTYKVIISPNATDANKLSGDGLAAIWLTKVGDYVEFIESQDTGYWEIVNERITSQLRLNTYAGYGGTDNKIMRFTTSAENIGNMFSENHSTGYSSNAKGLEITINRSGKYAVKLNDSYNSAGYRSSGLSLNSAQLTTAIVSITTANRISHSHCYQGTATLGYQTSVILYFAKNDVIRPHTDGLAATATALCDFTITYLGQ